MRRILPALLLFSSFLKAQSFPLESLILEGTGLSKDAILSISGLRIGAPVNQAGMEAASGKLRDTGLFESIAFRYAPGPKKGYVLTLTLEDQKKLTDAMIDLPGVDEAAMWQWVASLYPPFNRKVPGNDDAQNFLASKLSEHAKAELDGQRVVARMETDLVARRNVVSFQPENLPRIGAMNFTGQRELTATELEAVLRKIVGENQYTDRRFREVVELNLRRVYEEHGMYRVKFPKVTSQKAGAGAEDVTIAVEEGPKYSLGEVQFIGENLPQEAMFKAANFQKGKPANWTEIQKGIWATERPVKRTGYFDAASHPERIFHDDGLLLDVKVSYLMGPLYHAGDVRFVGLTPSQEEQARKTWKLKPGDPYDFEYPSDFLRVFYQIVDGRQFKKVTPSTQRLPNQVVDFTITFESK